MMEMQMDRILCATDFSDYGNEAVRYGMVLAKKLNAKLYVCHIIDTAFVDVYGEALFDPDEQQKRMTEYAVTKIKELMAGHTLEWEALIVAGPPADEISRLAEEHQAGLVIAAGHGRSGFKRLVLGSVAERLMRLLHRPLLILRGVDPISAQPAPGIFRRILVGYDFSPDSDLAITYAVGFAQIFQAELHIVHVMTTAIHKYSLLESSFDSREDFDRDMKKRYREKIQKTVAQTAPDDFTAHMEILVGPPDQELNRYARENRFDLIVLGTRGTGIIETLFIGSTTDRVVRKAECPVLCICHKI